MSNIVQFEDSNCRSSKGKEKAQGRPSKKRSTVWYGFEEVEEPDGSRTAKCLHCGKKLCCDSKKHGTTHLKRHLNNCCPQKIAKISLSDSPEGHENHELYECQESHLGYDPHNDQELSGYRDLAYDEQKNRELFVKMVIDSKTMLNHVENPFLKEFALSLQPQYIPVDRRTVEKDCLAFYENEKAKLKDKLSKLTSRVSFSLIRKENRLFPNYCVIAAHFINNNFKLEKRVVGFIGAKLESIDVKNFLNEWTFGKNVLAFTCDAHDFPIEKFHLERDEPLYGNKCIIAKCIFHYLQNISKQFFDGILDVIDIVEGMLEDLMLNDEEMSSFNQIALKHKLPTKTEFKHDDERGLGSKFKVLHDAYTYKRVLLELGNTDVHWNVVEEVVGLLNPINDMVVMLFSSECPTINLLVKLVLQVKGIMSNASPVLLSTKDAIYKSLLRLDEYLAGCDEMVHFASLLDPQLKLWFLQHCNGKGMPDKTEILHQFQNLYTIYESREVSNNPQYSKQGLLVEIVKYVDSKLVDKIDENFDVLGWWKSNELEYPILSRMARDILAIPITCSLTSGTEPLEKILREISWPTFSLKMFEVLVCCNNWLRSQREKENDLCATIKSGSDDPKLHLNYEGVRVAQGNNFTNAMEKCRELLVNMVISSRASSNLLTSSSFIEWARDLQPIIGPNVVSIERNLHGFYQIDRGMLPSFLDKSLARISFSVRFRNMYLSYNKNNYVLIYATVHYIDSDFNLLKTIIGIKEVSDIEDLIVAAQLERLIQERGLDENVLAFTISKSSSEIFHGFNFRIGKISLQCSIIGLFNELLKYAQRFFYEEYVCIREMIEFVGENSVVMQTFNELALEYKLPPKSDFRFDEENGWDSELNVVHDALPYRDVFDALKRKNFFPRRIKTLSRERWDNLECHVELCKPIYKAPIVLSSFKYPTSHLFLRIVFEIRDVISYSCTDLRMNSDHDVILDRLNNLLSFIDNVLRICNKILLMASVLDPQFKYAYLKRCYEKNIIKEEEVNKYMEELFNECEIEVDKKGLGMFELDRYMNEDCVEMEDDADFDILKWWKNNQSTYPILSRIARDILAIPVSSAPWELDHRTPKWYKRPRFVKSARLLDDCILKVQECSNKKLSTARTNNELEQGTCQVKKTAIDYYEKNISHSERCPRQVWDAYSISFVEHCLSQKISNEIVVIGDGRLTAEKMRCLVVPIDEDEYKKWIPDEVINCYIGIMKNQPTCTNKVLMLTSFETRLLESWGSLSGTSKKPYERTWNNIIQRGNSFYQYELVFLPINKYKHWFIGVINNSNSIPEFQILNSLDSVGEPYKETTHELRLGIQVCIDAFLDSTKVPRGLRPTTVLEWPIRVIPNLPKQEDKSSCGLFALKYMQYWDGSKLTCDFTQYDIHIFRKQLVGELIFSELNERKDIQEEIKKRKYAFN